MPPRSYRTMYIFTQPKNVETSSYFGVALKHASSHRIDEKLDPNVEAIGRATFSFSRQTLRRPSIFLLHRNMRARITLPVWYCSVDWGSPNVEKKNRESSPLSVGYVG